MDNVPQRKFEGIRLISIENFDQDIGRKFSNNKLCLENTLPEQNYKKRKSILKTTALEHG